MKIRQDATILLLVLLVAVTILAQLAIAAIRDTERIRQAVAACQAAGDRIVVVNPEGEVRCEN